jgi:hypothetical protein
MKEGANALSLSPFATGLTMNTKHLTQQADRALRLAARCGDNDVAEKLRAIAKEYLEQAQQPRRGARPQDRNSKKDSG